jgi:hypothetical protein
MADQYKAVKKTASESLDWRKQVRRRPVAWGLGALGAGFIAGYGIAAALKWGRDRHQPESDYVPSVPHAYAAGPVIGDGLAAGAPGSVKEREAAKGSSLFERFKDTPAYDRIKHEATSLGEHFVVEISNTTKQVVFPVLLAKLRQWLEGVISKTPGSSTQRQPAPSPSISHSTYQPVLERD